MTIGIIIVTSLIVLFLLYVLSTTGRTKHPGLNSLQGKVYAHRGLHDDMIPENSMEAFRRAKEAGYGVELDVHLLKDGKLIFRTRRIILQNFLAERLITPLGERRRVKGQELFFNVQHILQCVLFAKCDFFFRLFHAFPPFRML